MNWSQSPLSCPRCGAEGPSERGVCAACGYRWRRTGAPHPPINPAAAMRATGMGCLVVILVLMAIWWVTTRSPTGDRPPNVIPVNPAQSWSQPVLESPLL
jgi:hypothetical protein